MPIPGRAMNWRWPGSSGARPSHTTWPLSLVDALRPRLPALLLCAERLGRRALLHRCVPEHVEEAREAPGRHLRRALREDLETCLAHEAFGLIACAGTEDHSEAVRSFVEKRKPKWANK